MMEKLKPCPFCGGAVKTYEDIRGKHYVQCLNPFCDMLVCTFSRGTKEEAIAAWNRREGEQDNG